jgi:hypothetical protein
VLGENFPGIGVTDDYAAYKSLFSQHQLCWAHLIRKAIKLALQHPDQQEYANFLDQLCAIYDDAKRLRDAHAVQTANETQVDSASSTNEMKSIVADLQARIKALCDRHEEAIVKPDEDNPSAASTPKDVETFILLQRELMNNLDCLFVFVEHPEVEPTNNRSERNVRREAEIRKGARTSKTEVGAKRRSIIVTVLASLQTRIEKFTLANLLAEVTSWLDLGISIFDQELHEFKANPPNHQPAG